jgi:two-component system, OmpR family, alkaline phosphatase synthesis response regulator PhoP
MILDLMLPEMDGIEVCKKVRSAPDTALLPIIMLTAKAEESDIIVGLELGREPNDQQSSFNFGPLTMDLSRHEVTVSGEEVSLTAKEFGLLAHLLRHPGRVLTRDVLLNAVWGYDYYGTTRTVDVHIRRLKLKIPLLDQAIISIKSLGYKLSDLAPTK